MNPMELLALAEEARKNAYAPYSHFTVGAALYADDGSVFTGCNIENSSFSATCCAERVALYKAVSSGNRHFIAIAIAGGREGEKGTPCPPCGICRQVLLEFCDADFTIITSNGNGGYNEQSISSLMPSAFTTFFFT